MKPQSTSVSTSTRCGILLQPGFSLLELLVSLGILALLTTIGLPALNQHLQISEANAKINLVLRALQHARSLAVTQSQAVTLCGSNDGYQCQKNWQQYLIIFHDADNDQQASTTELLQRYEIDSRQGSFTTRAAFGKRFTRFDSRGAAAFTGSLLYCHPQNPDLERKITWSLAGRPYLTGNHTTRTGSSTIHCP